MVVSGSKITGSLKNVTEYTGYSDQPEEQSGHYLALKFEPNYEGSKITVEIVGNGKGPKELKSRDLVARIEDNSYKLKFVTTRNDEEDVQEFDLTGLTLEE